MSPDWPSADVRTDIVDDEVIVGRVGWTSMLITFGGVDLAVGERVFEALRSHVREAGEPPGLIFVIEPEARPPGLELRRELSRELDALLPTTAGAALVVHGSSLRLALVRSVVTGINMLFKQRASAREQQICGSLEEAGQWLARRGVRTSVEELVAGYATLSALRPDRRR